MADIDMNKTYKPAEESRIMALTIDIMIIIFLKMPVKPLLLCQCVCKLWRNTINTPYFIDRHQSNSSVGRDSQILFFKYPENEKAGGTIMVYATDPEIATNIFTLSRYPIAKFTYRDMQPCISNLGHGLFFLGTTISRLDNFLYNPVKGEKLVVPPSTVHMAEFYYSFRMLGLCFNSISKQYKLVGVHNLVTEVYTFGSNNWKQIAAVPSCLPASINGSVGTPAYGDTHWIARKAIVSFQFTKEEFKVTPLPDAVSPFRLFNFREDLAFYDVIELKIWVLRDYDNTRWEQYAVIRPCWYTVRTWGKDEHAFGLKSLSRLGKKDYKLMVIDQAHDLTLPTVVINHPSLVSAEGFERFSSYTVNLDSLARYADSTQIGSAPTNSC